MDLPSYLVEQIKSGQVALILGAGASLGAKKTDGSKAPKTEELRDLLADKYLGGKLKKRTLSQVAEYAIIEASLVAVQDFIRQTLEGLDPTNAHLMIPKFRWWGIATTNYDRLIESAYEQTKNPVQELAVLIENGDLIDRLARDSANVLCLKLHGCISRIANPQCPLILTVDQYIDHRAGRSRLFEHLTDWGYEHPLVFVGHSLQDSDLRQLIKDLTANAPARARFYCVAPDADPIEQRAFEQHRVTLLSGSFDEFMRALEAAIPSPFRAIVPRAPTSSLSVAGKFKDPGRTPSSSLALFLSADCEHVNSLSTTTLVSPKSFYKGLNPGFSAIEQGLDVRRKITDEILSDVFLANEAEHEGHAELILIKAHAGAGKTVLLRRLAWDASHDYDCLCLLMRPQGLINVSAIEELIELCDRRVYLFVDDSADRLRDLEALFERIGPSGANLTVITAERMNEWNVVCDSLNPRVTLRYELRYLSEAEIDALLNLLAKHDAEGELRGKTQEVKREAFLEIAGRQLLVALHEATFGSPFREIIKNEFDNIWPLDAKHIYLTICTLNRLNVPVRAGIIARIHGVPFEDFKKKFFDPLEHIVQAEFDPGSRDYAYKARHPFIAQMVFEDVLQRQEERFDQYIRCLGALNIDYASDRIAFRQMTRAKIVVELFSNHELASKIYTKATERAGPEDGVLLHQMALYELNRPNGNLTTASDLLSEARTLRKYDNTISHSFAELHLKLAEKSRTPLERSKHLADAVDMCHKVIVRNVSDSYPFVTLIKVGLLRLDEVLQGENALSIESVVKDIERDLRDGLQRFPNDSYLREAESRLANAIDDSDRAISALQKAFQTNPRSTFIAIRLSQAYSKRNDPRAVEVLQAALGANSNDRSLHHAYARQLIASDSPGDSIVYHLRRAFVDGDTNYDARLLLGRQLFLSGDRDGAFEIFGKLKLAPVSPDVRFTVMYPTDVISKGEIARMEATYCFIVRDGLGDQIHAHRDNMTLVWDSLRYRSKVRFRIGFTFAGPTAIDVQID